MNTYYAPAPFLGSRHRALENRLDPCPAELLSNGRGQMTVKEDKRRERSCCWGIPRRAGGRCGLHRD